MVIVALIVAYQIYDAVTDSPEKDMENYILGLAKQLNQMKKLDAKLNKLRKLDKEKENEIIQLRKRADHFFRRLSTIVKKIESIKDKANRMKIVINKIRAGKKQRRGAKPKRYKLKLSEEKIVLLEKKSSWLKDELYWLNQEKDRSKYALKVMEREIPALFTLKAPPSLLALKIRPGKWREQKKTTGQKPITMRKKR